MDGGLSDAVFGRCGSDDLSEHAGGVGVIRDAVLHSERRYVVGPVPQPICHF